MVARTCMRWTAVVTASSFIKAMVTPLGLHVASLRKAAQESARLVPGFSLTTSYTCAPHPVNSHIASRVSTIHSSGNKRQLARFAYLSGPATRQKL